MLEISATSSTTIFSAFRLSASSRHSNASFFESISVRNLAQLRSKIKSRVANGFGDGRRHEVVNWFASADTVADLGGGKPQREAVKGPHTEAGWGKRSDFAGAGNGDEFDKLCQFGGGAPFVQLRNVVRANEVKQFCIGKSAAVIADGVDGIGGAAALDFLLVNFVAGLADEPEIGR